MDVNGDGISDVLGFTSDKHFYCVTGDTHPTFTTHCEDRFSNERFDLNATDPYVPFSIVFADIDRDMSAELVFGIREVDPNLPQPLPRLKLVVFKLESRLSSSF